MSVKGWLEALGRGRLSVCSSGSTVVTWPVDVAQFKSMSPRLCEAITGNKLQAGCLEDLSR